MKYYHKKARIWRGFYRWPCLFDLVYMWPFEGLKQKTEYILQQFPYDSGFLLLRYYFGRIAGKFPMLFICVYLNFILYNPCDNAKFNEKEYIIEWLKKFNNKPTNPRQAEGIAAAKGKGVVFGRKTVDIPEDLGGIYTR